MLDTVMPIAQKHNPSRGVILSLQDRQAPIIERVPVKHIKYPNLASVFKSDQIGMAENTSTPRGSPNTGRRLALITIPKIPTESPNGTKHEPWMRCSIPQQRSVTRTISHIDGFGRPKIGGIGPNG
jgi:hypothetical protein